VECIAALRQSLLKVNRQLSSPRIFRYFAAMQEDAIFWIAIAATVAGLEAVAVSIARGKKQDGHW
jgi:hypothetical protein